LSQLWAADAGGQRRFISKDDYVMADKYQDYFDSLPLPCIKVLSLTASVMECVSLCVWYMCVCLCPALQAHSWS